MSTERTQPQFRRNYNVHDQWGRMWLVSVEKETGDLTGNPEACFTDPLGTPVKYMRIDPDRPYRLKIDYAAWLRDAHAAHADYQAAKEDTGRLLYGSTFKATKEPTNEMKRIIGIPPTPVANIERAAAGDAEMLGIPSGAAAQVEEEEEKFEEVHHRPRPVAKKKKARPVPVEELEEQER